MKLHCGEARIGGRGVDHSTRVIFGNSLLVYLLLAPPFPAAGGRPAACRGASSPRSLGRGAGTLPFPRRALPAVTGEASSLDPKQPAAPSAGAHQLEQPPPAGGNINTRRWGFFLLLLLLRLLFLRAEPEPAVPHPGADLCQGSRARSISFIVVQPPPAPLCAEKDLGRPELSLPACITLHAAHTAGGGSGARPTCASSPGSAGGAPAAAPEPPKPKCQGCACCHRAFACTRGCRSFTSLSTGGRGELKAAPAPGLRGSLSPPLPVDTEDAPGAMLYGLGGWRHHDFTILGSLCFAANSSGCGLVGGP